MQDAQNLRSEAYLLVRCNDEGEAQRSRWTFYETIKERSILPQILIEASYAITDPHLHELRHSGTTA
jgi:hypothetical protein